MCVCVSTVWAWTMRGHGAAAEVLEVVCVNSIPGGALGCWLLLLAAALSGEWVHHRSAGADHRPLLGCSGGHLYHDTQFHY